MVIVSKELKSADGVNYVEYIESTGTQYIDTDFKPNQDTRVVLDFKLASENTTNYRGIFGVRDTTADTAALQYLLWNYPSTTFRTDYFGTNKTFEITDRTKRLLVDKDKNVVTINGQIITNTAGSGQCAKNLYLLCANNGGSAAYFTDARVYSCQIYDNGVLVRDFRPCLDSDGVVCLYDKLNQTYYYNAGTGEFTAG